jgi:hypothetical protein
METWLSTSWVGSSCCSSPNSESAPPPASSRRIAGVISCPLAAGALGDRCDDASREVVFDRAPLSAPPCEVLLAAALLVVLTLLADPAGATHGAGCLPLPAMLTGSGVR